MAIKVKHEGNATSRIVASALGGEGKRNAEDSKMLAQKAAQENIAANRQLQGARAAPAAPGRATASLGHASLMSAPTPPSMSSRLQSEEAEKERQFKLAKENRAFRRSDLQRQGYSADQILTLEGIDSDLANVEADERLTYQQKMAARAELEDKRKQISPIYEPTPDPNDPAQSIREVTLADGRNVQMMRDARGNWTEYVPDRTKLTAQEIFDSGVDYNGVRYVPDGRGGLTPLESRLQYATQNRNANQEAKLAQKAWDSYQKFVEKKLEEKYVLSQSPDASDADKIFDRKKIMKEAAEEYEAIYGAIPSDPNETSAPSPTPSPNPEEGVTQDLAEETKEVGRMLTPEEQIALARRRGLIK